MSQIAPSATASKGDKNIDQSEQAFSPERLARLAEALTVKVSSTIGSLTKVNDQTRLLSLNAQIEAARAGGATGAAFGVVAQAIQELSQRTDEVSKHMALEINGASEELSTISKALTTQVRGTRLADLALVNIDLIDRNLYERTCDVRWWATDASLVDAVSDPTPERTRFASHRMGVILSAYTVYYDLVLADMSGRIIANGRPNEYRSISSNVKASQWFTSAIATQSGDEYGFEGCHPSELVNQQRVLAYSCTVREGGDAHGKPLGVLGILFNWDALAQTIVERTPLPPHEQSLSRVCIVDEKLNVLADSHGKQLKGRLQLRHPEKVMAIPHGFIFDQIEGSPAIIAHAKAPGYETYSTGWHSLILQKLATG